MSRGLRAGSEGMSVVVVPLVPLGTAVVDVTASLEDTAWVSSGVGSILIVSTGHRTNSEVCSVEGSDYSRPSPTD